MPPSEPHETYTSLCSTTSKKRSSLHNLCSTLQQSNFIINPRRACAARVTVVGSECLSVKSHLTYGASVRPENAVTYSTGNEGQKICGVFSETAPLQRSSTPSIVQPCVQSAIFPAESTHSHYSMGLAPPSVFPSRRIIISLPPLASLPLPLAAQRNGRKRMCSPVYLLMLPVSEKLALLTGIHRPWARVPSNSIAT